ncbi:MAG: hypothetical protein K9L86_02795 [Candidatus Omnitrophica bacterium]|nr:hypothetical protein [Candidatus Omnitrophota bacterium]
MNKRILMFCGNGYTFDEAFGPIIEEIGKSFKVDLLMGSYYFTDRVLNSVKRLHSKGRIDTYKIIHAHRRKQSNFGYHKEIKLIMESIKDKDFSLLLSGGDFDIFNRYLISVARAKGANIAIIQGCQLVHLLAKYRKMNRLNLSRNDYCKQKKNDINGRKYRGLRYQLGMIKHGALRSLKVINSHYITPFLVSGKFFVPSRYDKFNFTSGRADIVMCYDSLEITALKSMIPKVKNIHLVKHPVHGQCKCKGSLNIELGRKLLVVFSGNIGSELEKYKFERWVGVIKKAIDLENIAEIHLRFHPRTSSALHWPRKMAKSIKDLGCEVKIIDALKTSLVETVCNYVGILGAPSGALRAARAVCPRVFVTALPDCGDPEPFEQEWCLGKAEGINWIKKDEELEPKNLEISEFNMDNRLSVADILCKTLEK